MNNHAVPGKIDPNRYNNAKAKYKLSTDLKNVKIIQGGKEVTFGNVLANKFRQGKERFLVVFIIITPLILLITFGTQKSYF